MYMPGPQPHGLEAFEDRDVLGRVGAVAFSVRHKEKACKTEVLRRCRQCIRQGGS